MATALKDLYRSDGESFDQLVLPDGYRPSDDEDFMCLPQKAYFLAKLRSWKEAIVEESRATMAQLQVNSLREPDMADRVVRIGSGRVIDEYRNARRVSADALVW